MKRFFFILFIFLSSLGFSQSRFNLGIICGSRIIDEIDTLDGVLIHTEGVSVLHHARLFRGFIINGIQVDSIGFVNGYWKWYKGTSDRGKLNVRYGLQVGTDARIDSVYVNGSNIDSLYIGGAGYSLTDIPDSAGNWFNGVFAGTTEFHTLTASGDTITRATAYPNGDTLRLVYKTLTNYTANNAVKIRYNLTLNSGEAPFLNLSFTNRVDSFENTVCVQCSEGADSISLWFPASDDSLRLTVEAYDTTDFALAISAINQYTPSNVGFISPAAGSGGTGAFGTPFLTGDWASLPAWLSAGDTLYFLPGTHERNAQTTMTNNGAGTYIVLRSYDKNNMAEIKAVSGISSSIIRLYRNYYSFEYLDFNCNMLASIFSVWNQAAGADHTKYLYCKVHHSQRPGLMIYGSNSLVDHCEIYYCCAGTPAAQTDAHGIATYSCDNIIIQNCNIHHNTGDAIQMSGYLPYWTNLIIKDCELWSGPLPEDVSVTWVTGSQPGENAIDVKTWEGAHPYSYRPTVIIQDCDIHGFRSHAGSGYQSALNLKHNVDVQMTRCKVYDNEIAFRLRGPDLDSAAVGTHTGANNSISLVDANADPWITGTHSGASNNAILNCHAGVYHGIKFLADELIGDTLYNTTDGSQCVITDNADTTVTCTLAGGTENDWDYGDNFEIVWGDVWHGYQVRNITDGSSQGVVTSNTLDSVYAVLGNNNGLTEDDWDTGDVYRLYRRGGHFNISNCVIHSDTSGSALTFRFENFMDTIYFYHCTIDHAGGTFYDQPDGEEFGFAHYGVADFRNCLIFDSKTGEGSVFTNATNVVPANDNWVTDRAGRDYTLTINATGAINAGDDVGVTTDYLENPRVGNPDIGAYEKQ